MFAPHGYDIVVDTGHDDLFNPGRMELIFRRHKETGERLGIPTVIGEWGAFGGRPGNEEADAQMISILEKNLWSHTYWCWTEDIASLPEWRLLVRAYPVAVAGRLRSYHWDGSAFEMEYDAVPGVTRYSSRVWQSANGRRRYLSRGWQSVNGKRISRRETRM